MRGPEPCQPDLRHASGENSCAIRHPRTRLRSRRSKRASGSSRSTTCSSRVDQRASAVCWPHSAFTQGGTASRSRSRPIPLTSTRFPSADQPPFPGSREIETADQEPGAVERARHGRQGQQARGRHWRSHLDVCLGGHAVRSRIQPLLQGQGRRSRRRHHLLPGTRGARHLRARVSRRAPLGREAGELPTRAEGGRRPLVVSRIRG